MMPEEGIAALFLTNECVLCKGEEKGARAWYAQTDIGNAEPRRKQAGFLGIKREARAGSILPIQLACCDACRKRYLMLQYVAPVTAAASIVLGFVLMSIRAIREPLMAITPALPAIVFLVLALGGILGGWLWRGALHKRYGKMTYLSIFRIDTLRRMKRLGWFELYETKDVSRLVFSKKPFRQGLYTGASGHGKMCIRDRSLGLDIKVLAENKEEIKIGELTDDDDVPPIDVNIAGMEDAPTMLPASGDEFNEFDDFDFNDEDEDEDSDDAPLDGFTVFDGEDGEHE